MNTHVDMGMVRPALIATAACAMVWWFLVRPSHDRLSVAKAQLAEQRAMVHQLNQANSQVGSSANDELAAWVGRAQELNQHVRGRTDAASVYEQMTTLAQRHGILIKRIDPRQRRRVGSGTKAKDNSEVHVVEFGYKIDLEGGFEQVARFIDSVATESPLSVVTTISLTPVVRGRVHLVNATIETSHSRLDQPLAGVNAREQDQ